MSSVAALCRVSSRITARSVRRKSATRAFSKSTAPCAAQNFNLPSLSPTMEEGGIASWKVKEGDSFSTGDVLLEIETDKAQMDVEAQDDGILFKILEQDGAKNIKVGARIAVLAEPGDDLSTLEIPAEDNASSKKSEGKGVSSLASSDIPGKKQETSTSKSESSKSPPSNQQESSSSESSSSPPSESTNDQPSSRKYPLYPSVQYLLHTLNVSSSDVAKIPATGPSGRLLKGGVLSYMGKISKSYSSEQSKRITKLGHLDLSNIKLAAPKKPTTAAPAAAAKATTAPEAEPDTQIAIPISLAAVFATQKRIQESLGLTLPISTFIARASEIANEALPRSTSAAPTADDLFNFVLGLDKLPSASAKAKAKTTKGRYVPQITALPPAAMFRSSSASQKSKKPLDIIDMLTGASAKAPRTGGPPSTVGVASSGPDNVFSLSVKKGEEKRARVYLERVKTVLEVEPGRCVL